MKILHRRPSFVWLHLAVDDEEVSQMVKSTDTKEDIQRWGRYRGHRGGTTDYQPPLTFSPR